MKASSPSHVVWYVRQIEGRKKDLWTRVGAAWQHQSGKGFNMTLDFVPTVPGKFVILEKKEQPTGEIAQDVEG
jgi:hypothetical protein